MVRQLDVVGLLLVADVLPFVKTGGWNNAAAVLDGMAERGLLGDALGTGVDQMAAEAQILGPTGHKTPPQQIDAVAIDVVADYGNLLGRGDVEARLQLRGLDQSEYFFSSSAGMSATNRPHIYLSDYGLILA